MVRALRRYCSSSSDSRLGRIGVVKTSEIIQAWRKILKGERPSLSIEITRECPLHCPGCYAYEDAHLGGGVTLRELNDRKGQALVDGVLEVVDRLKPLHLSIVGGDPLVRYRELETMVPLILSRGVHVQVVTSAFRPLAADWPILEHLNVVVSIDGLQPEHDERRKPATYERILKNIAGARVTVHCTITSQTADRPGYLDEFLHFWGSRPEIAKVWFSLFTPQIGATDPEILTPSQRASTIAELRRLRVKYPVLDMPDSLIKEIALPPKNPGECIFARTTTIISADLTTQIIPCQFGGAPDCHQCGCIASMGLAAVGHYKVLGTLTAGQIFTAFDRFGKGWRKLQNALSPKPVPAAGPAPFKIL